MLFVRVCEVGEVGLAACDVGEGAVAEEERGILDVGVVAVLEDGEVSTAWAAERVGAADPGYGAGGALREEIVFPVFAFFLGGSVSSL